ncbi:MAG: hypothetical protein ACTS46_01665, partial [Candidatus Hodgkinia cicadicola]
TSPPLFRNCDEGNIIPDKSFRNVPTCFIFFRKLLRSENLWNFDCVIARFSIPSLTHASFLGQSGSS